ncbi:MAG: DUF2807 domain-containing protein [Muribaculum sp.]|nr:DUF2807 domain-containing protein [Muribaculum sp.]
MKTLITPVLATMLLVATAACAKDTNKTLYGSKNIVTKEVTAGNFNSIVTTSSVDVDYYQSKAKSITISAPDNIIDYIDVKTDGNKLKVGYKKLNNIRSIELHNVKVVVTVSAPDVRTFTTGSSGDIDIKTDITSAGDISFSTNSSGDIKAKAIVCKSMAASTRSSGDIEISSLNCSNLDAMTNSSGDLKINDIKATEVKATANSSGDIKLSGECENARLTSNSSGDIKAKSLAAVKVEATANSSGDIYCTGISVNTRKSSSGDINVNWR